MIKFISKCLYEFRSDDEKVKGVIVSRIILLIKSENHSIVSTVNKKE